MTWYAIVYLAVFLAFGIYSTYDDIRLRQHPAYILVDGAVTLLWVYFLFAYFYPHIALPGAILLLLLFFALVWTLLDVRRELQAVVRDRHSSHDPELSARANLWADRVVEAVGVLVGFTVAGPAIFAAIAVVSRAW